MKLKARFYDLITGSEINLNSFDYKIISKTFTLGSVSNDDFENAYGTVNSELKNSSHSLEVSFILKGASKSDLMIKTYTFIDKIKKAKIVFSDTTFEHDCVLNAKSQSFISGKTMMITLSYTDTLYTEKKTKTLTTSSNNIALETADATPVTLKIKALSNMTTTQSITLGYYQNETKYYNQTLSINPVLKSGDTLIIDSKNGLVTINSKNYYKEVSIKEFIYATTSLSVNFTSSIFNVTVEYRGKM